MPFGAKIQPINEDGVAEEPTFPPAIRQVPNSRFMCPFERQFTPRNFFDGGDLSLSSGSSGELDPSSACLRNMVETYIECSDPEKQLKCGGRNLYSYFNENITDSSDEEEDGEEQLRKIESLVLCTEGTEKTLEEEANEIVENNDSRLKVVVDELVALGYDAAICKSRWKKSKKPIYHHDGYYEYLDVMVGGERVLIDIDFKSKFEIARPTNTYKSISKTLPYIFVGQMDRLKKIVAVVAQAAKKSFKKNGLRLPPWRGPEYQLTKWVSPNVRGNQNQGETGDILLDFEI